MGEVSGNGLDSDTGKNVNHISGGNNIGVRVLGNGIVTRHGVPIGNVNKPDKPSPADNGTAATPLQQIVSVVVLIAILAFLYKFFLG